MSGGWEKVVEVGESAFFSNNDGRHDTIVEIYITRSASIATIVETIRYGI